MAEHLKLFASIGLFLLSTWVADTMADAFNDPTRPPAEAAMPGEQMLAAAGPVLQGVTISAHRKSAMISGQEVLLGQKYEDSVLSKINDGEVTLRHSDGTLEVLRMYPGIEKTITKPAQTGSARPSQHKAGKKE